MSFIRFILSATNKKEAEKITDALVSKKIISGSLITKGESIYWWKGKKVKRIYHKIEGFSLSKNKKKIIEITQNISKDDTPIICFMKINGSPKFLKWIKESLF